MTKNIIAGFVAGLVATTGVFCISAMTTKEGQITIEPTTAPITCEQGEQGPRGYTGTGTKGDTGERGIQGVKGDSVTVEQVLAALDAREDVVEIEHNLSGNGSGTTTVLSLVKGTYDVSMFQAGSGYFGASLNGCGKNIVFASQSGYVFTEEEVEITVDGDYTISITSEGQWTFDIEKR